MGAYVKLLEYDNIDGMILLSELSRRRIRSIQKLIRVGRNEVVVVLRVDKEKGKYTLFHTKWRPGIGVERTAEWERHRQRPSTEEISSLAKSIIYSPCCLVPLCCCYVFILASPFSLINGVSPHSRSI